MTDRQKINILFHIDSLNGGGAEKVLRTLVNNMDQTEFDITVSTVFPDEAATLLNSGIRYKAIYTANNKFNNLLYRIEAALGLVYRFHLKDNYDIECAYLENGATKIIASSTNKRAKKLAWVHCDFNVAIKDKDKYISKTLSWYKKYDRIVCVSEQCKKSIDEMYGLESKTVVLHNVVDSEEIIRKSKECLPKNVVKDGFTVCLVGRLTPPKKILRLLKAHKKLLEDGIKNNVWILGEGEERSIIEKYIEDNNLSSSVTLYGFQPNPYPFMCAADLLVCSSIYEGYSTFITEGVILGKPIVATNCSGTKDILGESEFGIVTENDDDAFYRGILTALSVPKTKLDELAAKSYLRGKDFSTKAMVRENADFFAKLSEA